jgi:hypothetical protein
VALSLLEGAPAVADGSMWDEHPFSHYHLLLFQGEQSRTGLSSCEVMTPNAIKKFSNWKKHGPKTSFDVFMMIYRHDFFTACDPWNPGCHHRFTSRQIMNLSSK